MISPREEERERFRQALIDVRHHHASTMYKASTNELWAAIVEHLDGKCDHCRRLAAGMEVRR